MTSLTSRASPSACLLGATTSSYGIVRGRQDNAHRREPAVLLMSHRAGSVRYESNRATFTARRGDLIVTDLTRPLKSVIEPGGLVSASVVLPYGSLVDALEGDDFPANINLGSRGVAALITAYIDGLEALPSEQLAATGNVFAGHLRDLLAVALRVPANSERLQPALGAARTEAIKQLVAARLSDPELTPVDVAAHLGISVRSLHLHFEKSFGKTFSDYLISWRLVRCHEALVDPQAGVARSRRSPCASGSTASRTSAAAFGRPTGSPRASCAPLRRAHAEGCGVTTLA